MPEEHPFTIGVEEEFHLVDAETRELRSDAELVLRSGGPALGEGVKGELSLTQLEIATPVCGSLDEVRTSLRRLRRTVADAAAAHGARIVASGTHPFSSWRGHGLGRDARYRQLATDFRQLANEQLICACHVHVGLADLDDRVQVIDRLRPWLPVVLALSASSPFWEAVDTGYASYRTVVFDRWPVTGPPPHLGGRRAYVGLVDELVATGVIPDATKLYWDARPSARYDTVEVRAADVCTTVDEAVMVAAIVRSLVRTVHAAVVSDEPTAGLDHHVVRAARWRAARDGLAGDLFDLGTRRLVPAAELVTTLLEVLRPDLVDHGEWHEVRALVEATLARGNGASRQRAVTAGGGSHRDVVDAVVEETLSGV